MSDEIKTPHDIMIMIGIDEDYRTPYIDPIFNKNNKKVNKNCASILYEICKNNPTMFNVVSSALLEELRDHTQQINEIAQYWAEIHDTKIDEPMVSPSKFLNLFFDAEKREK